MGKFFDGDAVCSATVQRRAGLIEQALASGYYHIIGRDRHGVVLFEDEIHNVIMTEGKNVMLDAALSGSSYTVVGPFLGLVTSTAFSAFAAGDTAASHAAWAESTAYTGTRQTCVWSAASAGAKALSGGGLTFSFTGSDVIQGCAVWYGTGAVATVGSTAGKLLSGGSFSGGTKSVSASDSITVNYTFSI